MLYNIQADLALPRIKADNRKQVFEVLGREISAQLPVPQHVLYKCFTDRENSVGSGVGGGVAIPDLKLQGLPKRFLTVATLESPVNFKSLDDKPVDIVCALLSPESDGPLHLRGLSRISRMFKNEILCEKLRETKDEGIIRSLILNPEGWMLAA